MDRGCPAVAVAGGSVWMINWLAAAGLSKMLFDGPGGEAAAREVERDGPGSVDASEAGERVATLPVTVAVAPASAAPTLCSDEAVITVLLSPVSMFPY